MNIARSTPGNIAVSYFCLVQTSNEVIIFPAYTPRKCNVYFVSESRSKVTLSSELGYTLRKTRCAESLPGARNTVVERSFSATISVQVAAFGSYVVRPTSLPPPVQESRSRNQLFP